jgi:hypothetical protein
MAMSIFLNSSGAAVTDMSREGLATGSDVRYLTPGLCASSIIRNRDQTRIFFSGELYNYLHLFEINQRSWSNDSNPFCPAELKPSGNSLQRTDLS